mmetsp:Transcript_61960/g.136237  ORF Transcript_61960/g.136237 Transcript_61960/m.136237 type:complete len:199 (-) Transcript_61960:33-629(-)
MALVSWPAAVPLLPSQYRRRPWLSPLLLLATAAPAAGQPTSGVLPLDRIAELEEQMNCTRFFGAPGMGTEGARCTDLCSWHCPRTSASGERSMGCCQEDRCLSASLCDEMLDMSLGVMGMSVWSILLLGLLLSLLAATGCTALLMCMCKGKTVCIAESREFFCAGAEGEEDSDGPMEELGKSFDEAHVETMGRFPDSS